jgi:hypothetical protein
MYRVTWNIDDDVLDALQTQMDKLPALTQGGVKLIANRLRARVRKDLGTQPGKPKYPIRWKSERQRRAFFATDGFGGGIPTRRSGALARGWQVEFTGTGTVGTVEIYNDVPYTRFVQGNDAQPFHLDTGWPQAAPRMAVYEDLFTDQLIELWFTLTDPQAGIR